ncbi:carboxypeptidase-like regulatory domain-containing protein [Hyalangium rubrum]|uniref:Carboxypeptidase-like regulatory domain-containing protein n=1 Tax=Hyalangium rubrum TaxID=3103134 RepID=A0ABU5H6L1_9BACT|nr:carboxypeptidase-like regulatory domain-containing protein [Hyalangium sp. s54d21]MDY7229112.1 carboxypeptidase-like regulatory domain-containing protein [Hyalangium sp. s54d21]
MRTLPLEQSRRQRAFGVALALLFMALPLAAQGAEPLLRISGRVLDPNGKPARAALVVAICDSALPEGPPIDCGFPGTRGRQGKTDGDGRFLLEQLPPAVYSLYAAVEAPGPGRKVAADASLSVPLRKDRDGVELKLKTLRTLSGVVVDKRGAPVKQARVKLKVEPGARLPEAPEHGPSTEETADDFGRFEFKGVPDMPYRLEVSAYGFITTESDRAVRPGDEPITVRMKSCGRVFGSVVKQDGSPVADLLPGCGGYTSSSPDGRFDLPACEVGPRRMCFSAPGMARLYRTITVEPEKDVDMGKLRMEPELLRKVRVTDERNGATLPHAMITVEATEEEGSGRVFRHGPDGWAELTEYPARPLDLSIENQSFLSKRAHLDKRQTELQVALEAGIGVSGKVLNAKGQPQMGSVQAHCEAGGSEQMQLQPGGEFHIPQGLAGGLCSVQLLVYTPPLPRFYHYRLMWMDPKVSPQVDFLEPAVVSPLHVRFQGAKKPYGALLFVGDLPSQVNIGKAARAGFLPTGAHIPESGGYRAGRREEGGLRFEDIGPGVYTLVVLMGEEGAFRVPLTMGEQEQTLQVEIPAKLTPLSR